MPATVNIKIISPYSGNELTFYPEESAYKASDSRETYSIKNNIIDFLKEEDAFYEGAYLMPIPFIPKSEKLVHIWVLFFFHLGYIRVLKKYIPKGSDVLELGCAGGIKYLSRLFNLYGLDISYKSLLDICGDYKLCIRSDASLLLPFADNSLDAVVSSFFWEHILGEEKEKILKECYRVLKPDGKLIFMYDLETNNSFIRILKKKDLDLYNKTFKEKDGHIGYQSLEENRNLFQKNKFSIIYQEGIDKTFFQSTSVLEKARHWKGFIGFYSRTLYPILNKRAINLVNQFLLKVLDKTIGKFINDKNSRSVITVCEKSLN